MLVSHKQIQEAARDIGRTAEQFLANENIFLAWIRTGLTLMSFGFVVNQFGSYTMNSHPRSAQAGASVPIGIGMVLFGGLLCVLATVRYYKVYRQIERAKVQGDRWLIGLVAALTLLLTVVMVIFMFLSSRQF